jgi:hypothetical protein
MRTALAAAVLALCAGTPALATGGFECRPVSGTGPTLVMTVGHTASASVVGATLIDGERRFSTGGERPALAVGQSWIDGRYLWLDLTDANLTRHEAKLRAEFQPKLRGRPAIGTLTWGGRSWRVRCTEG